MDRLITRLKLTLLPIRHFCCGLEDDQTPRLSPHKISPSVCIPLDLYLQTNKELSFIVIINT